MAGFDFNGTGKRPLLAAYADFPTAIKDSATLSFGKDAQENDFQTRLNIVGQANRRIFVGYRTDLITPAMNQQGLRKIKDVQFLWSD
jgi:hypothetical protein